MALIKTKPTSPGRRFVVKPDRSHLHKGEPVHALTAPQKRTGARNNMGRITTRHKGGGHRQRYRMVDFLRDKDGVPGKVERLEYDPNRTAHLALVLLRGRRASLHPRRQGHGRRRRGRFRHRGPDQGGQRAAAAQHPDRHDRCTTSS